MNWGDIIRIFVNKIFDIKDDIEDIIIEELEPINRILIIAFFITVILVIFGIALNIHGLKWVNAIIGIVANTIIVLYLTYIRYIIKMHDILTILMVSTDRAQDVIKQYFKTGFTLMMVVTGIFGVLTFVNFSLVSAGICGAILSFIALSAMREKVS